MLLFKIAAVGFGAIAAEAGRKPDFRKGMVENESATATAVNSAVVFRQALHQRGERSLLTKAVRELNGTRPDILFKFTLLSENIK
jgi:hypothetical protein